VGNAKGIMFAKGLALAIAYAVAYLALRHISFNQWFLPTGLRAACLLFLPYRYWLYIFLGESGAALSQKIGMADEYGYAWAYLSSILLAPLTALAPYLIRRKLTTLDSIARWAPLVAAVYAFWSSACKMSLNFILDGPVATVNFENFARYVTGDFLGTLMIVLPALIWMRRARDIISPKRTLTSAALALVACFGLFVLLRIDPSLQGTTRQSLMLLMIVPVIFLTYFYGWNGAAIGILLANIAIAQTLVKTGVAGAHDDFTLIAQMCLSLASISFLLFITKITSSHEREQRAGLAEQEALQLARSSLISSEPVLRDQLLCMAQLQTLLDEERDQLTKAMRAAGKHREALDLNSHGAFHRQIFQEQALALYPIGIETHGLFSILETQAFRESRISGLALELQLRGDATLLSTELQLLVYRCLCHAIDALSDWEPIGYSLRMRIFHSKKKSGIYASLTITSSHELQSTPYGISADELLNARIKAHKGIVRRELKSIRFILLEQAASADE
jgi:glucose-6-phosphate-specific signal transduction histidine kinase